MAVKLYDYRNRPIDMATLRSPSPPRTGRGRSVGWERITDGTQVDPAWVAAAIRKMERGNVRDFTLLAQRMGERFPAYMGALAEVTDALGAKYRVTPASTSRDDRKIADAVKRVVEGDAFQIALIDVRDAIGIGYSTVEMRWAPDAEGRFVPAEFVRVPPDAIQYLDDGVTPAIITPGLVYEPLEWGRFISHVSKVRSGLPVNVGMAKSCAYFYLFASLAWTSWSGYLERYGMPYITGTHRPGASDEEGAALKDVSANLGAEASAVFDETMRIAVMKDATASGAGNGIAFDSFIKAIDKQVRVAILKVDMTDTSGGSRALGEVLQNTKQARFRTFAFQESATFRRDIVRPIMATNFESGATRPAPMLRLDIEDSADMKELAGGLAPLVDRGPVGRVSEVLARVGLPVPDDLPDDAILFPLNSRAQVAADTPTDTKAKAYADIIMRIVDAVENASSDKDTRKRGLITQIKSIALDGGFELKTAA